MDTNHTTVGFDGEDILSLPIVELVPIENGFLIVRDLGILSPVECGHEDCYDLARYHVMAVSNDERHYATYNCPEHKNWLVSVCRDNKIKRMNH